MLTCVYHPINPMIVVEEDEARKLKASGMWFDCPKKARDFRNKVAEEGKNAQNEIKPKKGK